MEDIKILLSAIWVCVMFSYLMGDVLRILSGNYKAGEIGGKKISQTQWLVMAVLMVIPVLMIFLSLALDNPVNRWANILVAAFFFITNLIGLPSYPATYNKLLIIVGLGFNLLTVWYAWSWI